MFVAAGVLAGSTAAMAADMPELPPPPIAPPRPLLVNSGWYLRGDLGYRWGHVTGADSAPGFPSPSDNKLGSGFMGGIGVGYKSQWLRTDVTIDAASPLKYDGAIVSSGDTTAKITAVTTLFNGYLDLGSWYHITPYIGGGAGAAYLRTYDYASTAAPPFTGGLSSTQWKFALAAMAGVGYAVAPNIVVDVGYRYLNFGDVHTAADSFGSMTFKNVAAHELRVGLRWSFDDIPGFH
jgi:opacity protein-like surface antigen